jgi:nicotinamidase-related amidase
MSREDMTIVDDWHTVQAPPPPDLQPVEIDPRTTALLVLDLQTQNCNQERRPRCVASLPQVQRLLARVREWEMPVIFSLTRNATEADIREEVTPGAGEPVVASGVDKFYGTPLEEMLTERGVQTVILVGTAAHGAVLHTATGAALRGFRVVVPVDGMSAGDPYAEQYTSWHLANAPGTRRHTTLTRIDLISR